MVNLYHPLVVRFPEVFATYLTPKIIERLQILANRTVKPTDFCQLLPCNDGSGFITSGNNFESFKLLLRHARQHSVSLVKLKMRYRLHNKDIRSSSCI